ncbi:rhodanese-like domain-containing protein [Pseudoneobacillus rhizosphaerae]|uniref:Thiosulfate sulfurtransferase GlpE n=1 Tax=Pseudoneobacillus rhizosphaerae TaxID=2880968 RepID=A0A9C7LCA0_9BACI|nr:rhodanese-like domain-containing protein [Pseudoneobacillus rhizosphaerae]CAG9610337.1 Thiosulfate sulfurtransferase GlpE [Pseudoneobacillus rhizosphaerae]
MIKKSYLLFLGMLLLITACGNAGYKNVSTEEAKQLIDNNEVIVLDVRTPEEFQGGHIPGATLIPLQEFENRLNELDKEKNYLVVCRSGNRSAQASEILTGNGFSKIYNMAGGMNNWTFEIEN